MKKTLYDKLWHDHLVKPLGDGFDLLYIDRHLVHEVTSPQAFEGLKLSNRKIWNVKSIVAVPDHNVPTTNRLNGIEDKISRTQVEALNDNCKTFGLMQFNLEDSRQGIVHVVGPEQGIVLPGMTVVCGDSHTSTHGALACLAFGIGTSEVEHVMATQCIIKKKAKNMLVNVEGSNSDFIFSKDIALHIIGQIGTAGGTGYAIEYKGNIINEMSIESRMTLCNMTIEAGATTGLIAFDEKTFDYINDKPYSPSGKNLEKAKKSWNDLFSDEGSKFEKVINVDIKNINPMVTWGTSPEMVSNVNGRVPQVDDDLIKDHEGYQKALDYMGLVSGQSINSIVLDKVFIGSCTNSRIEDLRVVAKVVDGKKVSKTIKKAIIVPGSGVVKEQAEKEGLDEIFIKAGFEWRNPGCSMCLGMNDDQLGPYERCISTSNRNFEGRQGRLGRTHLASPATAAASAIKGNIADAREL